MSAILTRVFSQLYLAIGDVQPGSSTAVRLYYKPLVLLIWLGALIMAFGGALSLSDRRLRVGAPVPARTRAVLAPAERPGFMRALYAALVLLLCTVSQCAFAV